MIERTVNNHGVNLHTQSQGEGDAVIMLHGLLLGSIATWYFGAARDLTQHQVILYDLRGHGHSDVSATHYDLNSMVDDLLAVMSAYQLTKINLVGHSYGAAIAAQFALRHPEKVKGLFLVDMPCNVEELVAGPLANVTDREKLIDALPGDLPEKARAGKRGAKKLVNKLEHLLFDTSLINDLQNSPKFSSNDWAKLPTNTVALYGNQSNCLADAQAANGNRLEFKIINGGHFLPLEAGPEVSKLITEYFYG